MASDVRVQCVKCERWISSLVRECDCELLNFLEVEEARQWEADHGLHHG